MTTLEAIDHDIDGDLEMIAGRCAPYVTEPHGWRVDRISRVTARRGRLTVELHGSGYIYDSEAGGYGDPGSVPTSADDARRLADLYQQAEDILAAYRSGEYVPPSPLPVYYDRKLRDRSLMGMWAAKSVKSMVRMLNTPSVLMDAFDPLEPYTVKEKFENVWRAMRGEDPIPRRPKHVHSDGVTITLGHYA